MDFEKKYNTYKKVDDIVKAKNEGREGGYITNLMNEGDPQKRYYFLADHPGELCAYLKRRERIVIPRMSIREDFLCNISDLKTGKTKTNEEINEKITLSR